MRRSQKTHNWQRKPTFQRGPSWYPPHIDSEKPAPKATLPHKYMRVLKRLLDKRDVLEKRSGQWCWIRKVDAGTRILGKVKATLLTGLRALGYIVNIGGQWSITSHGLQAVQA